MNLLKLGNFMVGCNLGIVEVGREEESLSLVFSTGEAESVKHLIGVALSMEETPLLPEHIDEGRFQIQFYEDNTLMLCDPNIDGGIQFTWIEGDELITRIEDGYKMAMNDRQVGAQGKVPISTVESGEPFI